MKTFITLLLTLFINGLFGQTTAFSETFESGNSLTLANGTQTNKWFRGTANQCDGTTALYVSNNNSAYAYTITSATSTVHAYFDVSIPSGATNITLSFRRKVAGEISSGTLYDYLRISHTINSFTPAAGTLFTASGSDRVILGNIQGQTTCATTTYTIPNTIAGTTRRIIFTWRNDNSVGTQPPALIDNISLTYTPLSPPSCVSSPTAPTNGQTSTLLNQQLSWSSVSSATGYDVFFGTSVTPPQVSTNQAGTTYNPGTLNPSTTYYWRVVPRNSGGIATSCETWSFTTGLTGCLTAPEGLWPSTTYTPNCNGVPNTITVEAWTGEYSNVNVVSGEQYTFRSSVSTDYITISNNTATIILASGTTPVVWVSNITGVIRFYRHNNSSCGTSKVNRTISVQCGVEPEPGPCLNTTPYVTGPLPTREDPVIASLCNEGFGQLSTEYSQWNGGIANTSYTITSSITTDWLTVRRNTFNGSVVEYGQTPLTFESPGNDNYFIHVNTNGFCGNDGSVCRNITIDRISALPVELKDFYGKQHKNDNLIFWSTSSEKNSSHFIVESSVDGINWSFLTNVKGSGNSQTLINYSTIEYSVDVTKYYKLTQYDFDGQNKTYDPIVIIRDFKNKEVIKYVNILGQEINIDNHFGIFFVIYSDMTSEKKMK
jgi:hypothetical protein